MSDSMDELYRQLAARPLQELTGVVSASGSGGGMFEGDTLWTFTFELVAWRVDGGTVNHVGLVVRRLANGAELDALCDRVNANTVIKVRARIAIENVTESPAALLEEILGEDDSDDELNDCLDELLKPVVHSDEYFGDLILDRTATTFVVQTTWNGAPVELRLWLDEIDEYNVALHHAREFWANSEVWRKRILNCVARDCLPLKDENWRESDGSKVTREQFEARMSLRSVTFRPDGHFDVSYNDGGLFFGHDIVVMGSLGQQKLNASIHG